MSATATPSSRSVSVSTASPEAIEVALHSARVVRPGTDVTLAAYGPTVTTALAAAEAAAAEGHSIEVVDLRSVSPIDFDTLTASVQRTGRLVVAHEAPVFFGAGAEIAARITERAFYALEAPVLRVGGFHAPYPPANIEDNSGSHGQSRIVNLRAEAH